MMQTHTQTKPFSAFLLLLLFLAMCMAGCAADWPRRPLYTEPTVEPSTAASVPGDALDAARVQKRIADLEDFLSRKAAVPEEQAQAARELLKGYRRVLDALKTSSGNALRDEQKISAQLFETLVALEERSIQEAPTTFPSPGALRNLFREKTRIRDAFLSGDHEDVVRSCRRLEERYGAEILSTELGLLLAVSLAETGEVDEAIREGERVLPLFQGRPGHVDLGSRLVTWYLESGDQEQAREHYERLVDVVNEDRRLLDLAEMTLMPSPADPKSRGAVEESPSKAPNEFSSEYVDELLRRVDALVQQKAFDQAKLLLIRHRIRTPEGPQAEVIDRAMERLEREEHAHAAAPRREGRDRILQQESLEEVRRLVESEKFEEACRQMERMGTSEEPSPELQVLRDRAAAGIIGKKRDEAARAFLMAKNSSDPNIKKEHLRTAYHILRNLVDRFPTSPLLPKVQRNLDTVRAEMRQAGIPPESPETP